MMPIATLPSPGQLIQSLTELRRESQAALDKAQALEELAKKEGDRNLTAEEQEEWDQYWQEHLRCETEADRLEEADQRAARALALQEGRARIQNRPSPMQKIGRSPLVQSMGMFDMTMVDPRRGFSHMGEFALKVMEAYNPSLGAPDHRLLKIQAAASGMNQGIGSQGGYLIPPEFSTQIWDGLNAMPDNLMQYCDVYPVTGSSLTFPANAETSRVTGSRYGGIRAYWLAEAAQMSASMPTFRQMKLEPHKLGVLVYATDELMSNATALDTYIRRAAGEEIMWLVNDSIISGSGTGMPLGVLNSSCLITVLKESSQLADTFQLENVNKMYGRMHARARNGARWFINQDVEPALEGLNAVVGTGGLPVYIASPTGFPNVAEAPQNRLKGRPVQPIEYCKTLGDKGDVIFANLGFYAVGIRGGINEAMSIHLRFDYDEVAFRFLFSVDGQPWLQQPLTPAYSALTLSPFVTLEAR
jgi:HK97 family phage major capsid protein